MARKKEKTKGMHCDKRCDITKITLDDQYSFTALLCSRDTVMSPAYSCHITNEFKKKYFYFSSILYWENCTLKTEQATEYIFSLWGMKIYKFNSPYDWSILVFFYLCGTTDTWQCLTNSADPISKIISMCTSLIHNSS